jgi:hypothetical protein
MFLDICRCSLALVISLKCHDGDELSVAVLTDPLRCAWYAITQESSPSFQVRSLQFACVISPNKKGRQPHDASFAPGGCALSRKPWPEYERYWALDSCENCTMSLENTRSSVQFMATRSFFSNRGNLLR